MASQSILAQPTRPVTNRRGRKRAIFGSIDLGTNNCRMLIGTPAAQGMYILDSFSRVVRLGEGLYETGRLSDQAMERAIASLALCAERARRWESDDANGPIRLRAIATEACRQAENGEEFVHRARAATGLPLEIINSREEAELAVESCAPLLREAGRRALLFDIGGGSTEIAWVRLDSGQQPEVIGYMSLPVGVVTLSEHCAGACYQSEGFARLVESVVTMLRPFERVHRIGEEIRRGGVAMIGTSGTVTTLAGVSLKLERYRRGLVDGICLTRRAVDEALAEARALGREGLSRHPCIGQERVEFVLPGCAIFAGIHELWQVPQLMVADRGLREGMLMRLMRACRPKNAA
ncbi:MAG: Ppx/GppA family phosphatase [Rhodospirillales bacterium]|nr:Ppx/GppA family phosphatase [Rhodospirillales bacterium]